MLLYFILTLFALIEKCQTKIDLTPGGSLKLTFTTKKGECPRVDADLVAANKTLYDGRWYFVEVGFEPKLASTITCLVADMFIDCDGVLHDWVEGFEKGERKTVRTASTPIPGKSASYTLDVGIQDTTKRYSTLYYMDTEMILFWEVGCLENGYNYRNRAIGLRDLKLLDHSKREQINRINAQLFAEGGIPYDSTRISHKRCTYPKPRKNPFSC